MRANGKTQVRNACQLARIAGLLCDLTGQAVSRAGSLSIGPELELEEELEARAVGMSYQELEQYDPTSPYYDPDVGPYYWED